MELTPSAIYWIMQADRLANAAFIMALASVMGVLFVGLCTNGDRRALIVSAVVATPFFLSGIVGATFIPTTKTLVTMYGVPAAIEAAQTVELDETAKKSIKAVNKLLDSYLDGKD